MKKILLVCLAVATAATVNAQARFGIKAGAGLSNYDFSVKGLSPSANLGNKLGGYGGFVFNVPFGIQWGFQADLLYAYEGTTLKVGKNFIPDFLGSELGQTVGITTEELNQMGIPYNKTLAASANAHKIRLSAMLTFTPGDGITVMAGPYASYRVGTNVRFNGNLEDLLTNENTPELGFPQQTIDEWKTIGKNLIDDNIKKLDVGAALGVEYAFCNGIFIDFRYNLGLMNLLEQKIDYSAIPTQELGDETSFDFSTAGITPRVRYHAVQLGLGYRF